MRRHLDWLTQAQRDIEKARLDFQHEYWEWACFTAQQAAEKAQEAFDAATVIILKLLRFVCSAHWHATITTLRVMPIS